MHASYCVKVNSTKGRITSNMAWGSSAVYRQWRVEESTWGPFIYDARQNLFSFWTPLKLMQLISIIIHFCQTPHPLSADILCEWPRRQAEVVSVPFSLPSLTSVFLARTKRTAPSKISHRGGRRVTAPSSQLLLFLLLLDFGWILHFFEARFTSLVALLSLAYHLSS